MLRLLTVVACGTRTVIGAVFGSISVGETRHAPRLFGCLRPGMLLADGNSAVGELAEQLSVTGADLLIRCMNNRRLPAIGRCPDGSWPARLGTVTIRVIDRTNHQATIGTTIRSGLTTSPEPQLHGVGG